MRAGRAQRSRWPLLVIGGSAGTATWSGWVGLGTLTGFGLVHPLPGIWDGLTINTAITLPVGVEAYAIYALSVATGSRPLPTPARRYAWASAGAALVLGMAGQIAYHLLGAAGVTRAPWWVVAVVSCLPVGVLGAASLLWHLAADAQDGTTATATAADGPSSEDAGPRSLLDVPARSLRGPSRRRPRADDDTLRALVALARIEQPGAGEAAVRRLLAEAGLSASAARVRAGLDAPPARRRRQPAVDGSRDNG